MTENHDKPSSESRLLWRRHAKGDRGALVELSHRDVDWIRATVQARLGAALRRRLETEDIIQDTYLRLTRYLQGSQRMDELVSRQQLRCLLSIMVERAIHTAARWHGAVKRGGHRSTADRDEQLARNLAVIQGHANPADPAEQAIAAEAQALIRWAVELLPPEEYGVIQIRHEQGLTFAQIGTLLGISEASAKKRFQRAVRRVATIVGHLQSGNIDAAIRAAQGSRWHKRPPFGDAPGAPDGASPEA